MTVITRIVEGDLQAELKRHVGRYTEKSFDWDAFPSNRGFPALARAQMRFVGAGGSPKTGDSTTLKPDHFTVSLIHQAPQHYAALHAHEVEESFLVFDGVLTVGWKQGDEVVEARLGPKDMILNAPNIPHGFRNDGVEPVLMSVMVGRGKPLPPVYHAHPKDVAPDLAASLGAAPGHTIPFSPDSDHPLQQIMARHIVRFRDCAVHADPAGFFRRVYEGAGGIASPNTRKELITLPRGAGVRAYARGVEDAFFVMHGVMTVGWEENGGVVEQRLGERDLAFNPAGRLHYFRNDGAEDAVFFLVIGSPEPDDFSHVAA